MSRRVEAGMVGLDEYFQDASTGINAQILLSRSELSLSAAQLPVIKSFSSWEWDPAKVSSYPHINFWVSGTGEETEPNSRIYPVDIEITLIAPGKDIGGTAAYATLTLWRYFDTMQDLLNRRTWGSQGINLGGGGSVAGDRVESAILGAARVGAVKPPSPSRGRGNRALFTSIRLMLIEDW